jgi:hypothetical protein
LELMMKMARFVRACLASVCLAFGAATLAQAGTGISIAAFSFGSGVDSFAAFDPRLGTLNSVSFDLNGMFEPLILSDAAPYVGYSEPLFVSQSFTGLAGRGFSTILSSTTTGVVLTNTPGSPATVIAPFRDVFTFNAQSELIGFTVDSLGAVLGGNLADFVAGGPTGDLIEELPTYNAYAIGFDGSILPSAFTFVQGSGLVTYTYTTAPAPAPEPAAWAVMLIGFGLTGAILRRRSAGANSRAT